MIGLPKSLSVMPVARQSERAPAALRPWVVVRERRGGTADSQVGDGGPKLVLPIYAPGEGSGLSGAVPPTSSAVSSPLGSATRPSLTSDSTGRCRGRTVGSLIRVSSFSKACTRDFLMIASPFKSDHGTSCLPNIVRVA